MEILGYILGGGIIGFFSSILFSYSIDNSRPVTGLILGTLIGFIIGTIILL